MKYIQTAFFLAATVSGVFLTSCETYESSNSNASHSGTIRGTPVPGKEGFVTSPYAPYAGYVDVRGFPAGTHVNCPYSGKSFQVPRYSSGNHNSYSQQTHESPSPQLQQLTEALNTHSNSSSSEYYQNPNSSSSTLGSFSSFNELSTQ